MKKETVWAFILTGAMLNFAPAARGQDRTAVLDVVTEESTAGERVDVGRFLDGFLDRARVAADAAGIVAEADKLRREADRMLKAGQRSEARKLLRQAGELIAAAAPDRDAKRDDPFLRDYLREVTAALVTLEGPAVSPGPPAGIEGEVGDGAGASYLAVPRVAAFRDYWLGRGRQRLNVGRGRLALYRPMMARVFREEGVPEWLLAVAFVESTYSTSALSPKQAMGIWQFIPGTGVRFGLQKTAWTDERQHPEKSTRAAARYLRNLHALFGDWPLAIAAYNTGENRVARIMRRTGVRDFWTMANRGLLFPETVNYVPSVLAASRLLGLPGGNEIRGSERATNNLSRSPAASVTSTPSSVIYAQPATTRTEGEYAAVLPELRGGGETETLAEVAYRYNVPASEIRQTVPGFYDIPNVVKGRRVYVRIKSRQRANMTQQEAESNQMR